MVKVHTTDHNESKKSKSKDAHHDDAAPAKQGTEDAKGAVRQPQKTHDTHKDAPKHAR
ncbi:hypothetical protein AB4851_22985 [Burkholderia sp. 22PA0099]|uniref:hypothetical protein n=1 Tax=Burkholderia sp. 22PA0099 TaxID=3237372 RepID=UPI0039C15C29